jgi:hypothetical protein
MRKLLLAGAAAVAAVAVVASTASTNSNTGLEDRTVGFDQALISGATVTSFDYVLDATGAEIDKVKLVFAEDLVGQQIQLGFGPSGLGNCVSGADPADDDTDIDGVVATNIADPGGTIVTCDLTGQSTASADQFRLVVKTP